MSPPGTGPRRRHRRNPLSAAASSLADRPSDEIVRRLRWLPTDRPPPGTADVSAKPVGCWRWSAATPGTSSARSRKLRPFTGGSLTSACDTCRRSGCVPLQDGRVRADRHVRLHVADLQHHRQLERGSDGHRQLAPGVGKSLHVNGDLVVPDLEIRQPEASVLTRDGLTSPVGFGLARAYQRAWDDGALRIGDPAADAG